MKLLKTISYILCILLYISIPEKAKSLAWGKRKGEKFTHYAVILEPEYKNDFNYYITDSEIIKFNKNIKKALFIHDFEYGINDDWSFINRVEFETTQLRLGVNFDNIDNEDKRDFSLIPESQKQIILANLITHSQKKVTPINYNIEIKNNIISSNIEFGLKKNIFNNNGNTISIYTTIAPIPFVSSSIMKDKIFLKLGVSYGRNWNFMNFKNNYLELNASNKTYFNDKKANEQYLQCNIGIRLNKNITLGFSIENNHLIKTSAENYIIKDTVEKLVRKSHDTYSDIDMLFPLNQKRKERKLTVKLGYEFNNSKNISFDSTFRLKSNNSRKNISYMVSYYKHY